MKVVKVYSHLNGVEFLKVHQPQVLRDITRVIKSVDASKMKIKVSKEKTMMGQLLYSPVAMNKAMNAGLVALGWKQRRVSYWVTDDAMLIRKTLPLAPAEQKAEIEGAGRPAYYSYNQTDFVKDRVAVEVQFGKYSFVAYDLFVKHMAFYVGHVIDVGIEVLPMRVLAQEMSSGVPDYEGALYDLIRQGRGVPAVPLVIMGVCP
jgi:hypothetical protein